MDAQPGFIEANSGFAGFEGALKRPEVRVVWESIQPGFEARTYLGATDSADDKLPNRLHIRLT